MIRLLKDKIVYTNQYNPECREYIKKEVECLGPYLNNVVELSEDFTFGDIFKIIEREMDVFNVIFSSDLGHSPLQLYIDEIKKPIEVNLKILLDDKDVIDYLEIHRWGEYWNWGDIDLSIGVSGESKKVEYSYGIGLIPLNELKHLPLRLNEDFEISSVRIPSRLIRLLQKVGIPVGAWANPSPHVYVKGKVEFTVYELISSILNEISFWGEPEEKIENYKN